jgi:hypothetical protein
VANGSNNFLIPGSKLRIFRDQYHLENAGDEDYTYYCRWIIGPDGPEFQIQDRAKEVN